MSLLIPEVEGYTENGSFKKGRVQQPLNPAVRVSLTEGLLHLMNKERESPQGHSPQNVSIAYGR
jgi:hypothetical protein